MYGIFGGCGSGVIRLGFGVGIISLPNGGSGFPPRDLVVYQRVLGPVPLPPSLIMGGKVGVYSTVSLKVTNPLLRVSVDVTSTSLR